MMPLTCSVMNMNDYISCVSGPRRTFNLVKMQYNSPSSPWALTLIKIQAVEFYALQGSLKTDVRYAKCIWCTLFSCKAITMFQCLACISVTVIKIQQQTEKKVLQSYCSDEIVLPEQVHPRGNLPIHLHKHQCTGASNLNVLLQI